MFAVIKRAVRGVKNDIKTAKRIPPNGWVLLGVVAVGLPVFFIFGDIGRESIARPTIYSAFIISFTVTVKWPLRRHAWFLATMAVLIAAHVPAIAFIPWTSKWAPGPAVYGLCMIDMVIMLFAINLVAQFIPGQQSRRAALHARL